MKSNTDAKSPPSAGTSTETRRGRWPLTRAMSGAWGALGGRRSTLPEPVEQSAEARAQAARAREVLLRDRALSAEHVASARTTRERMPRAGALDIDRWIAEELADDAESTQPVSLDPISAVRTRLLEAGEQRTPGPRTPDDDGATFDMAALVGLADALEPGDAAEPAADDRGDGAPDPADPEPTDARGEPIRTRTMARLLVSQGYRDRALTIYDHLLAQTPDDDTLRVEADLLRDQTV